MRICDIVEELDIDNIMPTDNQLVQIIDLYPDNKWNEITEIYLKGIGNQHQTPGAIVHTLHGILDFYRENSMLTTKQKMYVLANLIRYWNQMNCLSRAELSL